jgi:transposase InsO family protein
VSRSWFYQHKNGRLPPRAQRRERLKAEVARLFRVHGGKYGSPRITADLREAGWRVSENTVAALMREQHLAARRKNKRKGTTRPGKGRWRAPDLVRRDFPAAQINRKWYGDGTEIPTGEGKLCLAGVLDMASRRVLGFALSEHHDAQLAYGALAMAVAVRGGQAPGVVFHTDQGGEGGQYTSASFAELAGDCQVALSVGRTGQRWDNALAESFFASIKGELIDTQPWPTRVTARQAIVEYIGWYNGTRLHSTLGYRSPAEFEEDNKIKKVA